MKLEVRIVTLNRGEAIKSQRRVDKFFEEEGLTPIGNVWVGLAGGKLYCRIEETVSDDIVICPGEKMPRQMLNGVRVVGYFEKIMEPGDVMVIHVPTMTEFLVLRQMLMVLPENKTLI